MRLIFNVALALLLCATSFAQTTYVFGVPSKTTKASRSEIYSAFGELVKGAKPGDKISLLNATELKEIVSFVIPEGSAKRRMVLLKNQIHSVKRFMASMAAEEGDAVNSIRFPQVLTMVARRVGRLPNTRVVMCGSGSYTDSRDHEFNYSGEQYPSDAFITGSVRTSPFGTKEKQGHLKGVAVHFSWLQDDWTSSLAETAQHRFLALLVSAQGGEMASWNISPSAVVKDALSDTVRPTMPGVSIDPSDSVPVIHALARPLPPSMWLMIAQDGSTTQQGKVVETGKGALAIAEAAEARSLRLHLGIVLYEQPKATIILEPKLMARTGADKYGQALIDLRRFVEGDEGSAVPPKMRAFGGLVDIVHGLTETLDRLESCPAVAMPVIVVVSDIAYQELSGDIEANRAAGKRILERLEDFIKKHPHTRVLAVYTPGLTAENESLAFFRNLAAAAGKNGSVEDDPKRIAPWVQSLFSELQGAQR